jgi:biotin carboxyl carrier protein
MTIKRLRVTVDGRSYDVAVETLEGSSTPTPPATPIPYTPAPPAPAPVAAPVAPPAPIVAPVSAAAPAAAGPAGPGDVTAPLSGVIVDVKVAVGATVSEGQEVVVLEAMKMQTSLRAARAGTVKAVNCAKGQNVAEGAVLVAIG